MDWSVVCFLLSAIISVGAFVPPIEENGIDVNEIKAKNRIRKHVKDILAMRDPLHIENSLVNVIYTEEERANNAEEDKIKLAERIGVLEEKNNDALIEISIITGMTVLERLENKASKGFNSTEVPREENVRAARWTYIFTYSRNYPPIQYILSEIKRTDSKYNINTEQEWIKKVTLTGDYLEEIETNFVKAVVETGKVLNTQKHRGIFGRNSGKSLIFNAEHVPLAVRETAYLLASAYLSYLDKKISD